jgi:hypothetical protein
VSTSSGVDAAVINQTPVSSNSPLALTGVQVSELVLTGFLLLVGGLGLLTLTRRGSDRRTH